MKLSFIKRINTTTNSIFYSLIKYNNEILGFGRQNYCQRFIKKVKLNNNFQIIEDNNIIFNGEDPRCFIYKEHLYIQDNYYSDMHLIDYCTNDYIKLHISGKNITFINHNDSLYIIHRIKPFRLYLYNITTNKIDKVEVDDDSNTYNFMYRGGTPGYKLDDTHYYGYGHKTYTDNGVLKHDIYKWIVSFANDKPKIEIIEFEQPENKQNICDPTSIIEIRNKKYLITAESNCSWFCTQDYITNVYEIID